MKGKGVKARMTAKAAETPTYPTRFGSHRSMVNEEETARLRATVETVRLPDGPRGSREWPVNQLVICTDRDGDYITVERRLDSNLADLFRYTSPQMRQKLLADAFGVIPEPPEPKQLDGPTSDGVADETPEEEESPPATPDEDPPNK